METWKANLEDTKRRYIDWWNHKGIVLNMWEHFQEGVSPHADVPMPPPPRDLNQKWFDPEWRAEYLDWYVAHSSLMADILPVANTQLGPGSLAAILGGVYEAGQDTIWIHPRPVADGFPVDDIVFNPDHPNYQLHKALLRACKEKAKGHYYVGMPDLMEGLDVLAAIEGTDKVLLDTVMRPEVVERQVAQINDIYFKVFDELYDIIREGDEMAFCYFSSWAPGKMSKLQSDISTMISQDDFRRFVQPFIREQCQKIDYTLYHLDGVGAIRHLDALLEIDELNAIQWTPGVGEPQGGSPKWYDLYRKILDNGKSIMACWVTLDELRPLLDHIGGDGVHIEMDFHNEREVEQAMRIVEEYKAKPLVLDGAMGTMIQQHDLKEEDFRGCLFAQHPANLKGCNDVLSLTRPDIIRHIHRKYLDAGADIIETNTFNAQRISLSQFGLQQHGRSINLAAAKIARECANEFSSPEKPRYVAGSIGPTSRTFISEEGEEKREELAAALNEAYEEQIAALAEGGVDALLIETIFDVEIARIAIEAARRIAPQLPIMLSFSVATPDGHNMLGQDICKFISEEVRGCFSVGINCFTDVALMTPLIRQLSQFGTRVSIYPNAGMPDAKGRYTKTPESLLHDVWPLLENHQLNIIGGCCGTTDAHIRLMAKAVMGSPLLTSPLGEEAPLSSPPGGKTNSSSPKGEVRRGLLFNAIVDGNSEEAVAATNDALAKGTSPQDLINGQMIRAMSEVGRRFQEGKAFVPQLLMAGRAMKAALELLKPLMAGTSLTSLGKVVIGTVKGDLHDIGKNLVASMLEGCGFQVVNIGIDVSADAFIQAVKENQPDILCMSALLTTTMGYMKEVIDALEAAGIRQQVKVMVGGAPVTQGFADEIGADGYSDNANSAVTVAKQLLGKL
ncbi:MAG: homocysteine S-methyltransferase family protein [Prevotella sp.]|nr:homocysteine S-methyltransferase family protein [Prevotella sp.]